MHSTADLKAWKYDLQDWARNILCLSLQPSTCDANLAVAWTDHAGPNRPKAVLQVTEFETVSMHLAAPL